MGTPFAGTIAQSFYTQVGRNYMFSCFIAHNPGIPEAWAVVSLNGELVWALRHRGNSAVDDMQWDQVSFPFQATTSQTTLAIQDATARNYFQGMALDGLSVTLAPN